MGKANISIGLDNAMGEPDSAPPGPYITDEDDGSQPTTSQRPGQGARRRRSRAPARTRRSDADLARRRKGPAQP